MGDSPLDTPRLILAHGFTQTARSWGPSVDSLRPLLPDTEFVAVDLPGHGAAAEVRADLWESADHLAAAGGPGVYVGYSMGGRVSLHAALSHPDDVKGLVLIGATAGIGDEEGRTARRAADEALATRLEEIGVEAFVDRWLTNPLFARLTAETTMRDDRLRNTVDGLSASLRLTGTGTQTPLWHRLGEVRAPALILAGEHDSKFRELGGRLADGIPAATFEVIPEAGHSVHLEQPAATAAAIAGWINRRWPGRSTP